MSSTQLTLPQFPLVSLWVLRLVPSSVYPIHMLVLVSPTSIVNLLSGRVDDSSFGRCLYPHHFYLRLKINIQAEMISYFWNLILIWKLPRWSWGTLLQKIIMVSDLVFLACRMNWIGVHLHLAFIGLNTLTQCQLSNICIENINWWLVLCPDPTRKGRGSGATTPILGLASDFKVTNEILRQRLGHSNKIHSFW